MPDTIDSLPTHYDHHAAQQRWYSYWEEKGYFHAEADSSRKPFTIVIPPPNVTGALHLGHALNNTLQDILIRMKRMQGYNALWMPGTDHAGIATQAVVERRLFEEEKLTRHDLGREKLVERIWEWKKQYETRIIGQLKQLGSSCDWDRLRFTLDDVCASAVRHTFYRLFRDENIYRGKRLVNWDTFLQTAVSDDEVVHETVKGHFWHISYPVIDPKPGEPKSVMVATTRPETMLGDTAVAVHPNPEAEFDRAENELKEKLAAASEKEKPALAAQLEELSARRVSILPELITLRDMALDSRQLMVPLVEREIPLIADRWAKPELGTGSVKITPAHDPNDYEVGLRAGLPMINIMNRDGTLNKNAQRYQGLTIKIARKQIAADLDDAGLLGEVEDREIDLGHSDRSKTPIEPYLADQWFVRMGELAQTAMDAVTKEEVRIFPPRYAKGYLDWLSEKRDWPVGRQLWWGHQIPIWSQPVKDQDQIDTLSAKLDSDPGVKAGRVCYQVELDPELAAAKEHDQTVHGAETVGHTLGTLHVCIDSEDSEIEARIEALGFVREEDVLDTWFSSALWPHSTLGWPEKTEELEHFYPTSVLITSRDIITLWVARMVLMGEYNMGKAPFRDVFIHPKILDGYGETMSKSKGNGVDPLDVIDKFGADALRFGIAYLTTETQDVRMPVEFECPHCQAQIKQTKKNRTQPRIDCPKCEKPFSTQWAEADADADLPRGAVVSERFELGRNFCNKFWNVSRLGLMNLADYSPGPVSDAELAIEDRWILSRLAATTTQVTDALEQYHYAEAASAVYKFAWDEFCSFYAEMVKRRWDAPETRVVAQRVFAHVLDNLLRLLHPMIPFLTEEVWQLLGSVANERGLTQPAAACESVMIAPWPESDTARQNAEIETRFTVFQSVLGAVREIRSRQNIPPKETIHVCAVCDAATAELLEPMEPYFESMARAVSDGWGQSVEPPATSAHVSLPGIEVYVDLKDFIDIEAEIARNEKLIGDLEGRITGKMKKLENENFVSRAPAAVVEQERESLAQMQTQLGAVRTTLEELRKQ